MIQDALKIYERLLSNVNSVIHGKDETIKLVLSAWFAGGHVLLEDNPGTGKTLLAKSLARTVALDFGRVQFTPDLLPSDITGNSLYDEDTKKFHFNKGPLFSVVLLADEINRATPRTQAALLEAMAEGQVTVDKVTYRLDPEFFVLATQNPIEQHGTFPLPEAQLDRFCMKLSMGYPGKENELKMMLNRVGQDPFTTLGTVLKKEHIQYVKKVVSEVKIPDQTMKYILDIVYLTREHPEIALPASPRVSLNLMRVGQAYSLLQGDDFVRPGTIFKLIPHVLSHRLMQTSESRFQGRKISDIIGNILDKVKAPIK
jgi:MoxR-like ATPase